MPRATLQSNFSKLSVDKDARIVTGVKLLENNRDVTYRGADGKPISFRTNEALLAGLIGHAGNRTIPSHLSHEWAEGKREALFDRVGGIKNCRLSDSGDLIGDYHAMPGTNGDSILWLAENDPEHCALSCIFDYNAIKTDGVTYAYPLSFESADFVAKGAGVKALLSNPTDTDMTKDEIQALVTESITAALSKLVIPKTDGLITTEEADKRVTAALAAYKPTLSDEDLDKAMVAAEAKLVAKLGAGPLQVHIGDAKRADEYTAKLTEYTKAAPNKATAIQRMLHDHPELGAAHEEHLGREIAKLAAA